MSASPWRIYFTVNGFDWLGFDSVNVQQRLNSVARGVVARQALRLPVRPMNAVEEAMPLLDPVYAHYVAQWRKIVPDSEEAEFGRGFFLEGSVVPEQIGDPSHAEALDSIARRNMPTEAQRRWDSGEIDFDGALMIDPRLIEWDIYLSHCVPAAKLDVEPYPA